MKIKFLEFIAEKKKQELSEEDEKRIKFLTDRIEFCLNNPDEIRQLVQQGADPNKILEFAIENLDENLLKLALELKADVNYKENKNSYYKSDSPIEILVNKNSINLVEILLKYAKSKRKKIEDLDDALSIASEHFNSKMCKLLIQYGADIHKNNDKILINFSNFGDLNMVKYLIELGVDKSTNDNKAFEVALKNEHDDVYRYLYSLNLNLDLNDNDYLIDAARLGNNDEFLFLVNEVGYKIDDNVIEDADINIINLLSSYEFQKDFLEKNPERYNEIKEFLLPKIEREFPELASAVGWGLM